MALADKIGKVKLYLISSVSHSITRYRNINNYIKVVCSTLDKIVENFGFESVDLLNLDVEGSAIFILKGAKYSLREKK